MPLFPMFADLAGRGVLVVGGGEVALRKIGGLLQAGAKVCVHASTLHPTLTGWCDAGRIERREGDFDPAWLDGAWLLVAATDDATFNARLAAEAARRRLWANVVDDARLSSFHMPAVIDRAPLQLAISTGGAAPMLARRLRERLETELDPSLGQLAALFAEHRGAIRERLPDLAQRRRWFDAIVDGQTLALLKMGRSDDAERVLLESLGSPGSVRGRISLVGTGPGDASLLTMGALRAMNLADVVLHDADVGEAILALSRKDAPRALAPDDRDAGIKLLLEHARENRHAVWLKRGDGFNTAPFEQALSAISGEKIVCEMLRGVG